MEAHTGTENRDVGHIIWAKQSLTVIIIHTHHLLSQQGLQQVMHSLVCSASGEEINDQVLFHNIFGS